MKLKLVKFFCLLLVLVACKNTEVAEIPPGEEMKAAFDSQKNATTVKRDILYSPQWHNSLDFEGNTYVPLITDKRISSYTADSIAYSLEDKIWLKAIKHDSNWYFFILTVLPKDPAQSKKAGLFLYEEWKTGQLSYQGYVEDKLYSPSAYNNTLKLKGYVKKGHIPPPCNFIYSTVCAGEGADQSCTTRSTMVCSDATGGGSGGGGGNDGGGTTYPPGGGTGTPPVIPEPKKPTEAQIKAQIKDKPFALIPNIPCDIIKKWIATAKFTVDQSTKDRLIQIENTLKPGNDNSYLTNVQNINNAYSTVVNMDYFPITVNMMPLINGKVATPEQFLEHIRKNINNFIDTNYSSFKPYVYSGVDDTKLWNSANPKNSVISIDVKGPDNASVIASKYSTSGWTFTTIYEPKNGEHPVSGNRDFGYTKNANGSYTFYTRGVDRLTSWDGAAFNATTGIFSDKGVPFAAADALWTSFQKGVSDYVNLNGGNAGAANQEIHRPDWSLVKDVIDGKRPLSSLSTDCK